MRKRLKSKYRRRFTINCFQRNYDDPVYKKWRKDVYCRDKYKCQWPQCKGGGRIHAHHIQRWADYPFKRFDIHNGITLCKEHHDKIKGEEDNYIRMFLDILRRKL